MPTKSNVLRVLERMSGAELRAHAEYRELAVSGSRSKLAARIAADCKRRLDELVQSDGPWTRDDWNDFVVHVFNGAPRRSFQEIRDEIERGLLGVADDVHAELTAERVAIRDLRQDDELAEHYADLLGTSARKLLNFLADQNGNRLLASLADDLIRYFQPQAGTTEVESTPPRSASGAAELAGASVGGAAGSPPEDPDAGDSEPIAPVSRALEQPPIGHLLGGRWRIVRELGRGGMGTVLEVTNRRGTTRVAKIAHGDGSDTEALVREAEQGMELAHENVCRYYDLDDDRRYGAFAIMQHCGESLDQRYARRAAEPGDAMNLLAQAAAGLDYLHGKGIVHGDVSPANIMVDAQGQVRITDFGIASRMRAVTRTAGLTHIGELRGRNAAYASDEVNSGHPPRRASDQASLAKVLCAILCGVEQYLRERRASFQRLGPAQAALDKALHHDVERRHASCVAFVRALMGGGS